jgi:hypothetical protein
MVENNFFTLFLCAIYFSRFSIIEKIKKMFPYSSCVSGFRRAAMRPWGIASTLGTTCLCLPLQGVWARVLPCRAFKGRLTAPLLDQQGWQGRRGSVGTGL